MFRLFVWVPLRALSALRRFLNPRSCRYGGLCRALIADPELVTKTLNGKAEDIAECVDCFECGISIGEDDGDGMTCPQNPDLP